MSVKSDLVTSLKNHAGLSALVSTRISAGALPQGETLPAVSGLRIISRVAESAADRSEKAHSSRVQIDCWASSDVALDALAVQVRAALIAFTTNTYSLEVAGDIDIPEPESGVFHRAIDALILHTP